MDNHQCKVMARRLLEVLIDRSQAKIFHNVLDQITSHEVGEVAQIQERAEELIKNQEVFQMMQG